MRRRVLESEEEEVARWVEILNESKTVEETKVIEFDLSTAEEHDEYVIKLSIGKSTGTDTCKGPVNMKLNGLGIGYFIMNKDYSASGQNYVLEVIKPVSILRIANATVSLVYNIAEVMMQGSLGKGETGTGKLRLEFPANYTGTVSAQVFAK